MIINNLEIAVEHKAIKNMHLSVYPPDGKVKVSAPLLYSNERIELYVLQKWNWIQEKRAKVQQYKIQPEREYVSGEAHFFKGQNYRLKVIRNSSIERHAELSGTYINLYVKEKDLKTTCEKTLYDFYKKELQIILDEYIKKWSQILQININEYSIKKMRTRWGSCSPEKRTIIFNSELGKKDVSCIEYVVLHELTHIIERTHGDKFQAILNRYMPDWNNRKQKLNESAL